MKDWRRLAEEIVLGREDKHKAHVVMRQLLEKYGELPSLPQLAGLFAALGIEQGRSLAYPTHEMKRMMATATSIYTKEMSNGSQDTNHD